MLAFAAVLAVPFALKPSDHGGPGPGVPTVVIMTPHVRQISSEFGRAFERWHRRVHGSDVAVDWRGPLGTSEIIKLLQAQFGAHAAAAVKQLEREQPDRVADPSLTLEELFTPGDLGFDLVFGGGSFDHGRLKNPAAVTVFARPWPTRGMERVRLALTDRLDPAVLAEVASVRADVTVAGITLRCRVPVDAVAGGRDAWKPIAGKAPGPDATMEADVDLARVERELTCSMSAPAGLPKEVLAVLDPNEIGAERLYDPQQHWVGTALSSFGIVYNRDVLAELGVPEPDAFADLADPRLIGMIALADPRQSGSLTTAIDLILNSTVYAHAKRGGWESLLVERDWYKKAVAGGHSAEVDAAWTEAWRLLREMSANTRYFTNSSTKPPIDVSVGDAAAGLAIDFYGRSQAQSVLRPGQDPATGRVAYVDPPGATAFDADPVSLLRGARNPDAARRFIEFCLTEEAQALWQFPSRRDPRSAGNPKGPGGEPLGPEQYELRRMPVRRDFIAKYQHNMIDKGNPFAQAVQIKPLGWRDAIGMMLPSFSIDIADDQRAAWRTLIAARADASFDSARLAQMEEAFYATPVTKLPDGRELPFTPAAMPDLVAAWRDPKNPRFRTEVRVRYVTFFRESYRRVLELARQ